MIDYKHQKQQAHKYHGVSYNIRSNSFSSSIMVNGQRICIYSSRDVNRCAAAYDAAKVRYRKSVSGVRKISPELVMPLNLPYLDEGEDRDTHVKKFVYPMSLGGGTDKDHPLFSRADIVAMCQRLFDRFRIFDDKLRLAAVNSKPSTQKAGAINIQSIKEDIELVKADLERVKSLASRLNELEDLVHNSLKNIS